MDPVIVVVAFAMGLAVRVVGLPPLVGFLIAGFALNALGIEGGAFLDRVGEFGVQLLLFSIGLKLKLRSLIRPEVWAAASVHMAFITGVFAVLLMALAALGLAAFVGLDWSTALLLAFALSFSSTVFAVKVFDEKGESGSLQSRIAIGILIVQDIFAVIFLTASKGKLPSAWALLLLGLPLVRPALLWLMSRCGHGELLVLLGVLFSLGSGYVFEAVDLKPDLGPLVFGLLVGSHPKADEMSNTLLGFKDLFLTGFFVSIGLVGLPGWQELGLALLLLVLVPFKVALFFALLSGFKLRARTALFSTLGLANYSEFGLIVGAVGAGMGWLPDEWLVTLAIAVSLTFVLAAPLNDRADEIYHRLRALLERFERPQRIPEEEPIDPGEPQIVIVGMGRVGTGAYDRMRQRFGDVVLGLEHDHTVVKAHREAGRKVILGSVTDPNLWTRVRRVDSIRAFLLALSNESEAADAARMMRKDGYDGPIAATADFEDQIPKLEAAGVGLAFNFYADAGAGFADHVAEQAGLEASAS